MKVAAELRAGMILIRSPYSEENKQRCRSLPGARWGRLQRAWIVAGTVSSAAAVKRAFPREDGFQLMGNPGFAELLARTADFENAQVHKTRTDLPDFPGRTEGWMHQRQAYWFAEKLDAAMLAMDMGTGKSKVVVGLAEGWRCNRVLILCPSSVVDVWPAQFNGPLEVPDPDQVEEAGTKTLRHGHSERDWKVVALKAGTVSERTKLAESELAKASDNYPVAIVINFEAAIRDPFKRWALRQSWDLVDLDESHRVKAPGGVTSRFCSSLGRRARKRLCNTGTPMPHSPLDVYSQFRFLDPGIFGTSNHRFKLRYAVMGGFEGKQVVGYQNQDELSRKFGSLAYMCDADEVLDLPEAMAPERRICQLERATARIYNELDREFVVDLEEGTVTAANALTRLLRLQQATSGHSRTDDDVVVVVGREKQKLLADVLADLRADEPVVIFTRFIHDSEVVRAVCEAQGRRFGQVSGQGKDLVNAKFPPDKDVLAVQMQSGGVGIDLTRAAYAIYYSVGFSLGDYLQSLKRIHRPGQVRTTRYYHLIAEKDAEKAADRHTVDEVVFRALRARENVIGKVIETARQHA